MAAEREAEASPASTNEEPPDADWIRLTEGMEPYERFRYIARHVLQAAVEEASGYATDERIFQADNPDTSPQREQLAELDAALREDGSLGPLEREFLCAAVARVMQEHDMVATCPWDLIRSALPDRPDARSRGR